MAQQHDHYDLSAYAYCVPPDDPTHVNNGWASAPVMSPPVLPMPEARGVVDEQQVVVEEKGKTKKGKRPEEEKTEEAHHA